MPPQEAPAGTPEAGGAPAGAPAEGGPEAGGQDPLQQLVQMSMQAL